MQQVAQEGRPDVVPEAGELPNEAAVPVEAAASAVVAQHGVQHVPALRVRGQLVALLWPRHAGPRHTTGAGRRPATRAVPRRLVVRVVVPPQPELLGRLLQSLQPFRPEAPTVPVAAVSALRPVGSPGVPGVPAVKAPSAVAVALVVAL